MVLLPLSCGVHVKKMPVSVCILKKCGLDGFVYSVGGGFAQLVRAFGASQIIGVFWGAV
jgi:hypothetical protein